jgi:hypothetical protein
MHKEDITDAELERELIKESGYLSYHNLGYISHTNKANLTDKTITHIVNHASKVVKNLNLSDNKNFTKFGEGYYFGWLKFPVLKTLNLSKCTNLYSVYLVAPELNELDLRGCRYLRSLKLTAPKLTTLYMDDCINLEEFDMETPDLKYLSANGCWQLRLFSTKSKGLVSLHLCNCDQLRLDALSKIVASAIKLNDLRLTGCKLLYERVYPSISFENFLEQHPFFLHLEWHHFRMKSLYQFLRFFHKLKVDFSIDLMQKNESTKQDLINQISQFIATSITTLNTLRYTGYGFNFFESIDYSSVWSQDSLRIAFSHFASCSEDIFICSHARTTIDILKSIPYYSPISDSKQMELILRMSLRASHHSIDDIHLFGNGEIIKVFLNLFKQKQNFRYYTIAGRLQYFDVNGINLLLEALRKTDLEMHEKKYDGYTFPLPPSIRMIGLHYITERTSYDYMFDIENLLFGGDTYIDINALKKLFVHLTDENKTIREVSKKLLQGSQLLGDIKKIEEFLRTECEDIESRREMKSYLLKQLKSKQNVPPKGVNDNHRKDFFKDILDLYYNDWSDVGAFLSKIKEMLLPSLSARNHKLDKKKTTPTSKLLTNSSSEQNTIISPIITQASTQVTLPINERDKLFQTLLQASEEYQKMSKLYSQKQIESAIPIENFVLTYAEDSPNWKELATKDALHNEDIRSMATLIQNGINAWEKLFHFAQTSHQFDRQVVKSSSHNPDRTYDSEAGANIAKEICPTKFQKADNITPEIAEKCKPNDSQNYSIAEIDNLLDTIEKECNGSTQLDDICITQREVDPIIEDNADEVDQKNSEKKFISVILNTAKTELVDVEYKIQRLQAEIEDVKKQAQVLAHIQAKDSNELKQLKEQELSDLKERMAMLKKSLEPIFEYQKTKEGIKRERERLLHKKSQQIATYYRTSSLQLCSSFHAIYLYRSGIIKFKHGEPNAIKSKLSTISSVAANTSKAAPFVSSFLNNMANIASAAEKVAKYLGIASLQVFSSELMDITQSVPIYGAVGAVVKQAAELWVEILDRRALHSANQQLLGSPRLLEKLADEIARKMSFLYEEQIDLLTIESAKLFAECGVIRILAGLFNDQIHANSFISDALTTVRSIEITQAQIKSTALQMAIEIPFRHQRLNANYETKADITEDKLYRKTGLYLEENGRRTYFSNDKKNTVGKTLEISCKDALETFASEVGYIRTDLVPPSVIMTPDKTKLGPQQLNNSSQNSHDEIVPKEDIKPEKTSQINGELQPATTKYILAKFEVFEETLNAQRAEIIELKRRVSEGPITNSTKENVSKFENSATSIQHDNQSQVGGPSIFKKSSPQLKRNDYQGYLQPGTSQEKTDKENSFSKEAVSDNQKNSR